MAEKRIEILILKSILKNEDFSRKVLPYIKDEYFEDPIEKVIYSTIYSFFEKYGKLPTIEAIGVEASKTDPTESEKLSECLDILQSDFDLPDETWLVENAEKFCQERAIFLALTEAVSIYEGKDKQKDKGAIPQILSDSLSISFDPQVGHDYLEDDQKRYEYYHSSAFKIPFHLEEFNKITKGGIEKKTLNIVMAGVGIGKTTFMCDLAAHYMSMGLDVLYITMEMADWKIAQKIDCNCMNITVDELVLLPHDTFNKKIAQMKEKIKGKLIVKEFPTGAANAAHFRHVITELKLKKEFRPAIILIDYLNICASSRLKRSIGSAETSYYLKSVSEELRGLAQENDCPLWTATQFTRGGMEDSDPEMTDVGECIFTKEKVELENGEKIEIGNISLGDEIKSHDGLKKVLHVFPKKIKRCFKIKTKLGKQIIISEDHVVPTNCGRKSIKNGLKIGDLIKSYVPEKS